VKEMSSPAAGALGPAMSPSGAASSSGRVIVCGAVRMEDRAPTSAVGGPAAIDPRMSRVDDQGGDGPVCGPSITLLVRRSTDGGLMRDNGGQWGGSREMTNPL